jgi:hypothetical protein
MKKYIITSEAFIGEATLTYDENGERPTFDCFNTNMRVDQHGWFMRWICERAINHDTLLGTLNASGCASNLKFQEVSFEPTFAEFWACYFKGRYKDNSSKIVAERRWNNMSKGAQFAAYDYIGRYFLNIPAGTQPKNAETYLNSGVWVR